MNTRRTLKWYPIFAAALLAVFILAGVGLFVWARNYSVTYLSWVTEETQNNISVFHVSAATDVSPNLQLAWREVGGPTLMTVEGRLVARNDIYELQTVRYDLAGLVPDREYQYCLRPLDSKSEDCEFKKFRSLPAQDAELRWISGGDMGLRWDIMHKIARPLIEQKPHMIWLGGDLTYEDGNAAATWRWRYWLKMLECVTTTTDGYQIPLIVALGNHEVNGKMNENPALDMQIRAPGFYSFFNQSEGRSYFLRRLGQNTILWALDSGHLADHAGPQSEWLKSTLEKYQEVKNKYAIYHAPLYPSVRDFQYDLSERGRAAWESLFGQYGLSIAFENHDHAMKITKRILNGQIVEQGGVLYLGDGAWGRTPRPVQDRPYLEKAESKNHVWWCVAHSCEPRY